MKFLKFDPIDVAKKGKWPMKQNINLKWSNALKVILQPCSQAGRRANKEPGNGACNPVLF